MWSRWFYANKIIHFLLTRDLVMVKLGNITQETASKVNWKLSLLCRQIVSKSFTEGKLDALCWVAIAFFVGTTPNNHMIGYLVTWFFGMWCVIGRSTTRSMVKGQVTWLIFDWFSRGGCWLVVVPTCGGSRLLNSIIWPRSIYVHWGVTSQNDVKTKRIFTK